MSQLELILRAAGVGLLVVVAVLMLCARRRDQTARIGSALCLSVAAFLVTSMPGASRLLGVFAYPLTAICSTHPVWFWLFCAALFADKMKLTSTHVFCLVAMAFTGTLYQWLYETGGPAAGAEWFIGVLGIGVGAVSLFFICLGPLAVFAGAAADLDERRRQIRTRFVPLVSSYLAFVVIAQLLRVFADQPTPKALVLGNLVVIDTLALVALVTFVRVRFVNWLDLAEPVPNVERLSRVERIVLDRLRRRFVEERPYAREGLTIARLAELLGTQEYVLRRVINRGLGYRNFNAFLHSHRLREAAARLRQPDERGVPVLTIALDVGYGSVGPFNRAFKARFGMTPTQYRGTRRRESAREDRVPIVGGISRSAHG